jgi:hypothetical protein
MPWSRAFDEPIQPPKGKALVTLRNAGDYIGSLPKAEQDLEEWQAAVGALLLVVEHNGPTVMARIGIMRALNRGIERVFNTDRKEKHWGKRKLKRDECAKPSDFRLSPPSALIAGH